MTKKILLEKIAGVVGLVSVAFMVCGTRACQENYRVGAQSSGLGTGTPSPSASVTNTETPTASPTSTGVASPEPTAAAQDLPVGNVPGVATAIPSEDDVGLLQGLSALGDKSDSEDDLPSGGSVGGSGGGNPSNWLGQQRKGGEWTDSDGDGFADAFEESANTDPQDASSMPKVQGGQLEARVRQADQDMDGLSDSDEAARGSNPKNSDSDGDGRSDGDEILSGSDLLSTEGTYTDSDDDGLSDSYEESHDLNPNSNDTDGDGLRDDLESVVGSDPHKVDSDGDGISDGKEYDIGSDPLTADAPRS